MDIVDRFERTLGCWLWIGSRDRLGYGRSRGARAHRVVYEQERGPVPAGHDLDHLCENHACVNPDHLEPVARGENVRRAQEMRAWRGQVRRFLDTGEWISTGALHSRRWAERQKVGAESSM